MEAPASEEAVQPVPSIKATSQKYNKLEIMKNAWRIYGNGTCTFSAALKFAWARAKEAYNTDTIADLQVGNIVELSFHDTFQKASPRNYTVAGISKALVNNRFYAVELIDWYGETAEHFIEPDLKVTIVSKASAKAAYYTSYFQKSKLK